MPGMNNTGIKTVQFLGNTDQGQLETISSISLDWKIEQRTTISMS